MSEEDKKPEKKENKTVVPEDMSLLGNNLGYRTVFRHLIRVGTSMSHFEKHFQLNSNHDDVDYQNIFFNTYIRISRARRSNFDDLMKLLINPINHPLNPSNEFPRSHRVRRWVWNRHQKTWAETEAAVYLHSETVKGFTPEFAAVIREIEAMILPYTFDSVGISIINHKGDSNIVLKYSLKDPKESICINLHLNHANDFLPGHTLLDIQNIPHKFFAAASARISRNLQSQCPYNESFETLTIMQQMSLGNFRKLSVISHDFISLANFGFGYYNKKTKSFRGAEQCYFLNLEYNRNRRALMRAQRAQNQVATQRRPSVGAISTLSEGNLDDDKGSADDEQSTRPNTPFNDPTSTSSSKKNSIDFTSSMTSPLPSAVSNEEIQLQRDAENYEVNKEGEVKFKKPVPVTGTADSLEDQAETQGYESEDEVFPEEPVDTGAETYDTEKEKIDENFVPYTEDRVFQSSSHTGAPSGTEFHQDPFNLIGLIGLQIDPESHIPLQGTENNEYPLPQEETENFSSKELETQDAMGINEIQQQFLETAAETSHVHKGSGFVPGKKPIYPPPMGFFSQPTYPINPIDAGIHFYFQAKDLCEHHQYSAALPLVIESLALLDHEINHGNKYLAYAYHLAGQIYFNLGCHALHNNFLNEAQENFSICHGYFSGAIQRYETLYSMGCITQPDRDRYVHTVITQNNVALKNIKLCNEIVQPSSQQPRF